MKHFVELKDVHKLYKLYSRPQDRLKELLLRKKLHKEYWALRGVSLFINSGETVGIIGLNGAGKSTLLQIIAGVLNPTSGEVKVSGRTAALLELGIGFHPEFTGRENIRMTSSLMGVKLTPALEEEIISFAEIGEFIDQPVKTYSSGMFMRLAFSLAVTVDPDILIIDEALSVGDQYFQKKSFDKIKEFKRKGKTIIFCSHSMYHVNHLCERAVWLHQGKVMLDGPAERITSEYENFVRSITNDTEEECISDNDVTGIRLDLQLPTGEIYVTGEKFEVVVFFESDINPCHISLGISRNDGVIVFATSTQMDGLSPVKSGSCVKWILDPLPLLPGIYELHVVLLDDSGNVVLKRKIKSFKVLRKKGKEEVGLVYLPHKWEIV